MEDWGEIKLIQIDSYDFWILFNELCDDNSGFYNNKSTSFFSRLYDTVLNFDDMLTKLYLLLI